MRHVPNCLFPSRMLAALMLLPTACVSASHQETGELRPLPMSATALPAPAFDGLVDWAGVPACKAKNDRKGGATGRPTTPTAFEDMGACQPLIPPAAFAGQGEVNADGDCAFASGVTCHYHDGGNEFGRRGMAVGEAHCIVPTSAQPTVIGFLFQCRAGTALAAATHKVAACGVGLGALAATCSGPTRCCQDGNLTKDWSKQSSAERAIHPNFAICSAPQTIDCSDTGPLAGLHGHPSNDGAEIR